MEVSCLNGLLIVLLLLFLLCHHRHFLLLNLNGELVGMETQGFTLGLCPASALEAWPLGGVASGGVASWGVVADVRLGTGNYSSSGATGTHHWLFRTINTSGNQRSALGNAAKNTKKRSWSW